MSQFTSQSRARKRDTDADSVKGSEKVPKGNQTESEFARSAARAAYERGEERGRERNDTERLGRERRKDRTGLTEDTREPSPAPGRDRHRRDESPFTASVKGDAETERGEKHHKFFSFGKKNKDKEGDDTSMAETATNASERRAREGESHVKPDKNIQKDRGTNPGGPRSEKLSGDGAKRTHPAERDAGHRRRKEGKDPEYEDELRHRGGEGEHDSTRPPPRAARDGDKTGRHETREQRKEREDREKRDHARVRERDRHQGRRDGPEQHRPGTRGTLLQRFFDPEELDDDKPCEGCGKAQPHCKTCQQGLPRRHVLHRVLGREIDQTEEGIVEGPPCEECEQPIPLCEICGLPSDVLRERGQAKARKQKFE